MSRTFVCLSLAPSAAATVFVTDPRFPVKHLFQLFFDRHLIRFTTIFTSITITCLQEVVRHPALTPPGPTLANHPSRQRRRPIG